MFHTPLFRGSFITLGFVCFDNVGKKIKFRQLLQETDQ